MLREEEAVVRLVLDGILHYLDEVYYCEGVALGDSEVSFSFRPVEG